MSLFGGGPSGLQGLPLALSSKIKTLWKQKDRDVKKTKKQTPLWICKAKVIIDIWRRVA